MRIVLPVVLLALGCTPFGEAPLAAPPSPDAAATVEAGRDAAVRVGMIRIPASTPFLIDAREVTVAEFMVFKSAPPAPPGSQPGCNGKSAYGPTLGCIFQSGGSLPMHCVDWCDAYAYCAWANKRLCRRVGGGPYTDANEQMDPTRDEWTHACTGGDVLSDRWPYGAMRTANACNNNDTSSTLLEGGSRPACEGGFPGIFDMTGNVWEWTDPCGPGDFGVAACAVRGGSYNDSSAESKCNQRVADPNSESWPDAGFRCCADP